MKQNIAMLYDKANYLMLIEIALIVLVTYFTHFLLNRSLVKFKDKFKKSKTIWNSIVLSSVEKPLKLLIWLIGFTIILDVIHNTFTIYFLEFTPLIRKLGIILLLTWITLRVVNSFEDNLIKGSRNNNLHYDKFTADLIAKIAKVGILIVTGLIVLESLGFSVNGILALGGIGGAAIAFASQNLLSNFFGTMTLYFDKPFAIGELIEIKEGNIKGWVDEIGWRVTKLRTTDQSPLYLPNSIFTRTAIINQSRISNRKFFEKIGLKTNETSLITKINNEISSLLERHQGVDISESVSVYLLDFGPDFFEIVVDCFIATTDSNEYNKIRQALLLQIHDLINQNDVKIMFTNSNKDLFQP